MMKIEWDHPVNGWTDAHVEGIFTWEDCKMINGLLGRDFYRIAEVDSDEA